MSWQLAAFGLLGAGLLIGFGWYERTRPDAKTVALVGTLAALAALGRIAFAPLPNVKPTTDIVLIAGYTLGGPPGLVVGAVTGLTSNFFFGQGPWTPWQMGGWAMTGVLGAVLAQLTGGRLGRRSLAAVCFAIGFGFTALQDVGDWVTYSDHSAAQLGVYVGKGIGFDLIHAVGCAAFAMAFGPALIRALARFRRRMTVRWSPEGLGVGTPLVLVALAAGSLLGIGPARAGAASQQGPVQYLLSAQNSDGGFGNAPGQASNPMVSGWATMALAAAGHAPTTTSRSPTASTAAQYLEQTVRADLGDPGSVERTMLAARAAGENPSDVGGVDLTSKLRSELRPDGSVAEQTNLTAFAVLALRGAGQPIPVATVNWLLHQQDRDGGFNFATAGATSDVDDTAAVIEALGAAERSGRQSGVTQIVSAEAERAAVGRALGYLKSQQHADGGFPGQSGGGSNAQSTAFAIQGLIAAGIAPTSVHRPGGSDPVAYLRSLITPSGAVSYATGDNQTPVWVTAEAELALAGRPLPVLAPAAAKGTAPSTTPTPASTKPSQAGGVASNRSPAVHSNHGKRHPSHSARSGQSGAPKVGPMIRWIGSIEGVALGLART